MDKGVAYLFRNMTNPLNIGFYEVYVGFKLYHPNQY